MSSKEIIRQYFDAWTGRDVGKARTYLADDLDFQGAIDRFTNADDFARALGGFLQILVEAKLLAECYGDSDGMLLYDCVTRTPAGTIRTAEYLKLAGGKIREIKLVFDATELRKMMAG